jgi:hypothetical protein
MQFQDYLKEFLRVLVKMIRSQIEDNNIIPSPQVAFLVNGNVYCESIGIDNERKREVEAQRMALYWRKKNPDAAVYINSGKMSRQGQSKFFDQYRTDYDFDNHKGDIAVQLTPLIPQLENAVCMLLIFNETMYGLEFQETRPAYQLDDITRLFRQRMESFVQQDGKMLSN